MKKLWVFFSITFLIGISIQSSTSHATRIYANKREAGRESLLDIHKRIRKECIVPSYKELVCLETPSHFLQTQYKPTLNGAAGEILGFKIIGGILTLTEDAWSKGLEKGGDILGIDTPYIDREELSWKLYNNLKARLQLKAEEENLSDCQRVAVAQCAAYELIQDDPYSESLAFLITRRPMKSAVKNGYGSCGEVTRVAVDLINSMGVEAKIKNGVVKEASDPTNSRASVSEFFSGLGSGHTWLEVTLGNSKYYVEGGAAPMRISRSIIDSNYNTISSKTLRTYEFIPTKITNEVFDKEAHLPYLALLPHKIKSVTIAWGLYLNDQKNEESELSSSEEILHIARAFSDE